MADISREELDELYEFAVELGKQAGKMMMETAKLRMGEDAGRVSSRKNTCRRRMQ